MTIVFTTSLIRQLRGSPLTVLIAFMVFEQGGQVPVTAQMIKTCTGYGDHAVTNALGVLENYDVQLIVRVKGGWCLASAFQLPLVIEEKESRFKRGFGATTATARLVRNDGLLSAAAVEEGENRALSAVNSREKRDIRAFGSADQELIRSILKEAGIGEPTCTRLALQEGMSPILALAHAIKAAYENIETGLLVHRLRSGDTVEETYRRKAQKKLDQRF